MRQRFAFSQAGQRRILRRPIRRRDFATSGDRTYVAHALGTVARARGGIAKLAAETGLQRQALHKVLGKEGNPRLDTLLKVLKALGLRARVEIAEAA